jgi:hypothetical protein
LKGKKARIREKARVIVPEEGAAVEAAATK